MAFEADDHTVERIRDFASWVKDTGYHAALCKVAFDLSTGRITRDDAVKLLKPFDYPNRLAPP